MENKTNVAKPTFAELAIAASYNVADEKLSVALKKVSQKFDALFEAKSEASIEIPLEKKPQPFVVDMQNNVYSILGKDSVNPNYYNASVGLFTAEKKSFRYAFTDVTLNENDEGVDAFVNEFINHAFNARCEILKTYWNNKSSFRTISRLLLRTLASEVWIKWTKHDLLVPSQFVEVKKEDKETHKAFQKRRAEFFRLPIKRNWQLLRDEIRDSLTHKDSLAHANALVHMLKHAIKRHKPDDFDRVINSNQKLVPTIPELSRLGLIPDIRIKEYKSLFHPSEWEVVCKSTLLQKEMELKSKLVLKIGSDDVENVLAFFNKIREDVEKDPLANTILDVKKKRLGKANVWKRQIPNSSALNAILLAPKRLSEENVRQIFSPFTIMSASGIQGAGEADVHVTFDAVNQVFIWNPFPNNVIVDPVVLEAGQYFVNYLNRG